jgi:NADPH:quinone reductase-like Zn-dependent oxidoreductase
MAAVVVREVGGVSKLLLDQARALPPIAPHQVLVKNAFAGLNMHDTYTRSGLYPLPMADGFVVGCEGSGVVAVVGSAVTAETGVREGDRVAYLQDGVQGTYAEYTPVDAGRLMPVPDTLTLELAAAVAVQGTVLVPLAAPYLVRLRTVTVWHCTICCNTEGLTALPTPNPYLYPNHNPNPNHNPTPTPYPLTPNP